jgi:hypothetical protein
MKTIDGSSQAPGTGKASATLGVLFGLQACQK